MLSRAASAEEIGGGGGQSLSRKTSFSKRMVGGSPGRKGSSKGVRKLKSAQMKLDMKDVSGGVVLSWASSASLGFSFSFTGLTTPPPAEEIAGGVTSAAVDVEAGVKHTRMMMEPTLPIYLKAGKTVIITIHQPSSRLFHKFDKLIHLGKGSLLYFGKASEAIPYFHSIGCSPLIAMNPAEFLLDLANGNINDVSIPSELDDRVQTENSGSNNTNPKPTPKDVHEYLVKAYERRVDHREKRRLLMVIPTEEVWKAKVSSSQREWGANRRQQYSILFWRGLEERRHAYLSWMRTIQVTETAIVLGLLWWQSDSSTEKGLQDQAGLLFFIAVFWRFLPVFTAIFTFPQERAMLNNERAVDMYRLSAYFMASTTSDLPLDLFLPIVFLSIVYFMAGLRRNPEPSFLSMLTAFLSIVAARGLGLAIGASLMDIKKATTLASVTVMTFMLAGGFFVKRVPAFISWIRYMSFNYHTYRLLLKVQYDHIPTYLNATHIDNGFKEVIIMIAMVFGYRLLAYVSLRRINPTEVTEYEFIGTISCDDIFASPTYISHRP